MKVLLSKQIKNKCLPRGTTQFAQRKNLDAWQLLAGRGRRAHARHDERTRTGTGLALDEFDDASASTRGNRSVSFTRGLVPLDG
ncbi:hypothetical protein TIFTF001_019170 [Ficus carica]|uniref:Uncharacterized protein n=1 Tax=Ficus carica TaxID=3494 RepID=A0AA88AB57_FICCA|nr:hypothetical protein TIFTF001_019170 [Ficus carica]